MGDCSELCLVLQNSAARIFTLLSWMTEYGSSSVGIFATSYTSTLQWMRDINGKHDIVIIIPVL
jgi:hypothetical protein